MSSSVPGCPAAWESDEDADLGIPELYDADLAGHGDEESEEEVEEEEEFELAISRKHAKQNYNFAGTLMKEEKEKVEVEDFKEIMDERQPELRKDDVDEIEFMARQMTVDPMRKLNHKKEMVRAVEMACFPEDQ
jgi:hypothetical protein